MAIGAQNAVSVALGTVWQNFATIRFGQYGNLMNRIRH